MLYMLYGKHPHKKHLCRHLLQINTAVKDILASSNIWFFIEYLLLCSSSFCHIFFQGKFLHKVQKPNGFWLDLVVTWVPFEVRHSLSDGNISSSCNSITEWVHLKYAAPTGNQWIIMLCLWKYALLKLVRNWLRRHSLPHVIDVGLLTV